MASDTSEAVGKQELVFRDAGKVYRERHALRGDAWAEHDIDDAIHHIRSKSARVEAIGKKLGERTLEMDGDSGISRERAEQELVDDALDLINYTAFLIRRLTDRV